MKTPLITTALFITFASASSFAQHPAADIADPGMYAMMGENLTDTPHADMVMENMSQSMEELRYMEELHVEEGTGTMEKFRYTKRHRYMGEAGSESDTNHTHETVDTIVLYDDAVNVLAD